MKDLDFDELDKAVNSLMTKNEPASETAPAVEAPVASTQEEVVSRPPSESVPTEPVTLASTPESSISPVVPARPAVASQRPVTPVKRSGRFMDVVHPSSDMTNASNTSPAPARQGNTLAPLTPSVTLEQNTNEEVPQDVQSEVSIPTETVEQSGSDSSSVHPDWPDPLDMHEQVTSESTEVVDDQQSSQSPDAFGATEANVQTETAPALTPVAPAASPFLPDAKVEKRPLGNPDAQTPVKPFDASLTDSKEVVDDSQEESKPDDSSAEKQTAPTPLPAELQSDVLKIESDYPKIEKSPDAVEPGVAENSAPISIAQQYKQQPRSGDQSHVAMYDDAAHPLTHPAKKKSGWLIVVVILLIIVLGAGGAAALFYLDLL